MPLASLERTMLRLKPFRKIKVPNRLAVLGAFLLIGATVAGSVGSIPGSGEAPEMANTYTQQPAAEETPMQESITKSRKSKGFKVSLFLFRRN